MPVSPSVEDSPSTSGSSLFSSGSKLQFMRTLDTLKIGDSGTILSIRLPEQEAQRLTEMGLTVGASIKVQRLAPLGDPMEIIVRGYHLSLRKSEAAGIEIQ